MGSLSEAGSLAQLQHSLSTTFLVAHPLVAVDRDIMLCGLCNDIRRVGASLTAASDTSHIKRSISKGGTFLEGLERHARGEKHRKYVQLAASKGSSSKQLCLSFGEPRAPEPFISERCGRYRASTRTDSIPTGNFGSVEVDLFVLFDDGHDGMDGEGNVVLYADRRSQFGYFQSW